MTLSTYYLANPQMGQHDEIAPLNIGILIGLIYLLTQNEDNTRQPYIILIKKQRPSVNLEYTVKYLEIH